jgi:hypothetical protein
MEKGQLRGQCSLFHVLKEGQPRDHRQPREIHTTPSVIAFNSNQMRRFLANDIGITTPPNGRQLCFDILNLRIHFHNRLRSTKQLAISCPDIQRDLSVFSVSRYMGTCIYPTSERNFSLLLAMSRRNSCSTRRTVGIGY